MKIVINKCFGGFELSAEALARYKQLSGMTDVREYSIKRNDPLLVKIVEELKEASFGMCADLKVVEIPDGIDWEINNYDGVETVVECHRSWS